jgi:hypothetical protein
LPVVWISGINWMSVMGKICNVCGHEEFGDMKSRKAIKCLQCGSLERTRLLWMYIERELALEPKRILHIAPEKGIYSRLSALLGNRYVCADIDPSRYTFAEQCEKIDLCDLEAWGSRQFDLIIHSHVLEHVPCNVAYSLFHLHRMLTDDGIHLCIIPFVPGSYDECYGEIGDHERHRRFGQKDHVRSFGADDIDKHVGKLIDLPAAFDARNDFSPSALKKYNIPKSHWKGFHPGTVLRLERNDMRFVGGI